MDYIKKKLALVPNKPGCYLMKNVDGIVIYVGKAKKLKNRLASYFRGKQSGKTAMLVREVTDFDYIVVESETESLILELNLIKEYDPKYNILLKDDKSYPYIELTKEKYPRLVVVRNINKKKNKTRLFGPYPDVTAARYTVNMLNRIYPLRKCVSLPKKYCLYYFIDQCLGYCENKIDEKVISDMEVEILKFLKGDHSIITSKIRKQMFEESEKLNFEQAKELKDLLDYIEITLNKQKVEISDIIDRDIFGYYSDNNYLSIEVFFIRGGKIVEVNSNIIPLIDTISEELTRYIAKFYEKDVLLPKELLVPDIVEKELLENYFSIDVKSPIKGDKKKIIDMACDNAKKNLVNEIELIKKDEEKTIDANNELKEILNLNKLDRIEIFDNSNLFGSFNVSGMVVFKNGVPSKKDYRKFKITLDKNDDYGTMKEAIYRRYFKVLKDSLEKPDLIIVDGGIGQINVAREVIDSLNLDIPVIGLKKDKKHNTSALLAFSPLKEIEINKRSNLFYLLERMQEEVHNFTINYHKQIRSKGSLESLLDNIEGIGTKRKKELLKKYKTTSKLKELSTAELNKILPSTVSENLIEFLKEY